MDNDEPLILMIIPSLVAQLLHAERSKGSPLTREEVLRIRDNSECVAAPLSAAKKVAEARGYDDLDPELAWEQWQLARARLLADQPHDE